MLQPVLKFIFSYIPCFSQQMEEMFFLSMIHITDHRMIKNGEKPSRLDFALRYWHPSSTDVSDPRSKLSHNCQAKKKSNDKNRGLEVGNGCGLTPPSLAALYISRCFSLRLWNDIYVFFVFFFRKIRILSPGQLSWEQAKNLHGGGTAAEVAVKTGMPISQANYLKTGLEIS